MIVRRRWRAVAVALLTTAVLWLVYCVRAGVDPLHAAIDYLHILRSMYSGEHQQVGVSELARLAPQGWEDRWRIVVALGVTVAIAAAIVRSGRNSTGLALEPESEPIDRYRFVPGLVAAGILVTFRHLSYAFVSLLPAAAYVLLGASAEAWPVRRRWFWALQAGLIVDVPTFYRLAQSRGWSAGMLEPVFTNFDRGFLLATVVLLMVMTRPAREAYRWASGAGT